MASKDSFGARTDLEVGGTTYEIFRVDAVEGSARLPYTHKVLLENAEIWSEDGKKLTFALNAFGMILKSSAPAASGRHD